MASIDSLMWHDEHLMTYLTPPNSPPQCATLFSDLDTPLSNTFLLAQDDMSFDKLSATLSRALTPPPETFTPHPLKQESLMAPTMSPSFHPNCSQCLQEEARALSSPSTFHHHQTEFNPYADSPLLSAFSDMSDVSDFTSTPEESLFDQFTKPATPTQYTQTAMVAKRTPASAICKPKPSKTGRLNKVISSKDIKPTISTSTKRESHNMSERHRRLAMKESFDGLRKLIPEIANNDRVHTGQVLKAAIDFVTALQREDALLCKEKEMLREEIRQKTAAQHA